jgi:molybdopterin-containing oxidoreductase family membrane subunit
MNKIILLTGCMVGFAYGTEFFIAWYSGAMYEQFAFVNRAFGQYAWAYWIMVSCNVIFPQLFWFKKFRTSIPLMFVICLLVNVGMWFERFVIIVTSLAQDFVPSAWGYFEPTWVDMGMLIGSFGLFMTLFLLFIRYLPVVAIAEIKAVMPEADPHGHGHDESAKSGSDHHA